MIWRNLSILVLFFILSSSTCEREVELDIPVPTSKLVIYSTFADNQAVHVQVSASRYVIEASKDEYLPGALVEIYQEDTFLEELKLEIPRNDREVPYYTTTNFSPLIGETYTIKAFLDGYEPVEAKSTIPLPEKLSDFSIENLVITTTENRKTYKYDLNIKIDDPLDKKNFYHLKITQQTFVHLLGDVEKSSIVPIKFSTKYDANDILASKSGGLLIEDDALKSTLNFEISQTINPAFERIGHVFVELRTISRDYYLFHSSVTRQAKNANGLLTEPVFIYNNVNEGHGIFAGYSSYTDSLSIVD